jgi:hypothetical protein
MLCLLLLAVSFLFWFGLSLAGFVLVALLFNFLFTAVSHEIIPRLWWT